MPEPIDFDSTRRPRADWDADSFDDQYVLMSDRAVIHRDEVLSYYGVDGGNDPNASGEHHSKIDTIVISTVAGMSAVALGLALRRLRKKAKGE